MLGSAAAVALGAPRGAAVKRSERRKALAVRGEFLSGRHLDQRPHFQRRGPRMAGRRGRRRRRHGAEDVGEGTPGKRGGEGMRPLKNERAGSHQPSEADQTESGAFADFPCSAFENKCNS